MKSRMVRIVVDVMSDATLLELVAKLRIGEMVERLAVTIAGIEITEPKIFYHKQEMVEDDRQ